MDFASTWYETLPAVNKPLARGAEEVRSCADDDLGKGTRGRQVRLKDGGYAIVRLAQESDLPGIVQLTKQLGYAADDASLARRLVTLQRAGNELVLVIRGGGQVLGWMQISDRETLEGGKSVEIVGLVIDERARRNGLARVLVKEAAAIGQRRGRERIVVRTNLKRDDAKHFYERIGFTEKKIQRVYETSPDRLL